MWYRVVLLLHILAGMAWVGGGLVIQVTEHRALRQGGRSALDRMRRDLAWADTWLAVPAPLLVVATGVGLVIAKPGWRFSPTWIWMAIVIVVLYQALALTHGARLYREVESGAQNSHGADPGASLVRLGWVFLVLLIGIVALMVFKPA